MMPDPLVWRALSYIAPLRSPERGYLTIICLPALSTHWPAQMDRVDYTDANMSGRQRWGGAISGFSHSSTTRFEYVDPLGRRASFYLRS